MAQRADTGVSDEPSYVQKYSYIRRGGWYAGSLRKIR